MTSMVHVVRDDIINVFPLLVQLSNMPPHVTDKSHTNDDTKRHQNYVVRNGIAVERLLEEIVALWLKLNKPDRQMIVP